MPTEGLVRNIQADLLDMSPEEAGGHLGDVQAPQVDTLPRIGSEHHCSDALHGCRGYLTGQRPADVRELDRRNIKDGVLVLRQGKTKMQMRIAITGELKVLIDRLLSRKRPDDAPISTRLLLGEDWLPIGKDALRYRFDKARERAGIPKDQFQFRDLRAKAGTDKTDSAGDIRQAQQQLGHKSVTTTEIYVRKRRGALTSPTK